MFLRLLLVGARETPPQWSALWADHLIIRCARQKWYIPFPGSGSSVRTQMGLACLARPVQPLPFCRGPESSLGSPLTSGGCFFTDPKCIWQSLLISLSTGDNLGGSDVTEIAISPLGEWGEKYNSEKTRLHILYEGVCVFVWRANDFSYSWIMWRDLCMLVRGIWKVEKVNLIYMSIN